MNLPFKLRENTGYCIPEGPAFSSARQVSFTINGTNIEFLAPQHKPISRYREEIKPDHQYKFRDINFQSNFNKDIHLSDSWKTHQILYRSWAFNGPWFTGPLAELDMSLILIRPTDLNEQISYFHPRAFEQAVGDYLSNRFSLIKDNGRPSLIAPVNWLPIKNLPVVGARLQVAPDESLTLLKTIKEYFFFPIADQCLVAISFYPAQLLGKMSQKDKDKHIDRSTMLSLMNDIIDSLKITLSPEAQAWQEEALKGLDDTTLIKNFPPMKWPTD